MTRQLDCLAWMDADQHGFTDAAALQRLLRLMREGWDFPTRRV